MSLGERQNGEWRDRGGTTKQQNGRTAGGAERPATYDGGIVDWWLGYVLNLHDLFTVHTDTDDDDDTDTL
jgi:hypothetical protein